MSALWRTFWWQPSQTMIPSPKYALYASSLCPVPARRIIERKQLSCSATSQVEIRTEFLTLTGIMRRREYGQPRVKAFEDSSCVG